MKNSIVLTIILVSAMQVSAALTSSELSTLHNMLVKFYGYQRAGLKIGTGSANNLNANFSNASHNGDNYNGTPVDGGWYDAGDFVKFGMNLGYSVYCLLKGYDVFPTGYDDVYSFDHSSKANSIPDILDEVKFATDYMMKAVISENTIILDVGYGDIDHLAGFSPPNNPNGRDVNQIFTCTGADIPATYAACLALMSTVYKKHDAAYSASCLEKAKVAFTFAKNCYANNKPYCNSNGAFYTYPTVNGSVTKPAETERKIAAGVELYRASTESDPQYATYKAWARSNVSGFSDCAGYAYIAPLASFEVWRQGLGGATALVTNVGFIVSKIKTTGRFTKVYQNSGWGTASDVGTAAFEMALAYVLNPSATERATAKTRIDEHLSWVVGKGVSNTQSFICGFNSGPTSIHYRTSSKAAIPGAVVAGPFADGGWTNDGSIYQNTEPAINYNAGHVGAVAFLKALSADPGEGYVKMPTPFTATPETNIDFTKGTVKFSAGFSKSVSWVVKIEGANGSKTYKGTGTSVNQAWDGSADVGTILAGEIVIASIQVEGTKIVTFDLAYASPIEMVILKNTKQTPKANDILLDAFEDLNETNEKGGTWTAFGTGSGINMTTVQFAKDSGSGACVLNGSVKTTNNKNWAGVKATFNSAGTATNVGQIKSILFDMRANKDANVSVELEQSNITDNAYHSVVVPVRSISNRYRVNIANFAQPDWKTSAKPLDLSNLSALRFTVYDSTGMIKVFIDNVYIEDLKLTPVSVAMNNFHQHFNQVVSNGSLLYTIPQLTNGTLIVTIFNVAGKNIFSRSFSECAGREITLPISNLPSGMYTVVNSINGKPFGGNMKIFTTK